MTLDNLFRDGFALVINFDKQGCTAQYSEKSTATGRTASEAVSALLGEECFLPDPSNGAESGNLTSWRDENGNIKAVISRESPLVFPPDIVSQVRKDGKNRTWADERGYVYALCREGDKVATSTIGVPTGRDPHLAMFQQERVTGSGPDLSTAIKSTYRAKPMPA